MSCSGRTTHGRRCSGGSSGSAGGPRRAWLAPHHDSQRRGCEPQRASATDDAVGALSTEPDEPAAARGIQRARRPSPTDRAGCDFAPAAWRRDDADRLCGRRRGRDVRLRAGEPSRPARVSGPVVADGRRRNDGRLTSARSSSAAAGYPSSTRSPAPKRDVLPPALVRCLASPPRLPFSSLSSSFGTANPFQANAREWALCQVATRLRTSRSAPHSR